MDVFYCALKLLDLPLYEIRDCYYIIKVWVGVEPLIITHLVKMLCWVSVILRLSMG